MASEVDMDEVNKEVDRMNYERGSGYTGTDVYLIDEFTIYLEGIDWYIVLTEDQEKELFELKNT